MKIIIKFCSPDNSETSFHVETLKTDDKRYDIILTNPRDFVWEITNDDDVFYIKKGFTGSHGKAIKIAQSWAIQSFIKNVLKTHLKGETITDFFKKNNIIVDVVSKE